ncbi:hypothetical protein MRX96_007164 [Rhipicephalus microplus]
MLSNPFCLMLHVATVVLGNLGFQWRLRCFDNVGRITCITTDAQRNISRDRNHTSGNYREDYTNQRDPYVTTKRLQKEPDIDGTDHTYSAAVATCCYGPVLNDFFVFTGLPASLLTRNATYQETGTTLLETTEKITPINVTPTSPRNAYKRSLTSMEQTTLTRQQWRRAVMARC